MIVFLWRSLPRSHALTHLGCPRVLLSVPAEDSLITSYFIEYYSLPVFVCPDWVLTTDLPPCSASSLWALLIARAHICLRVAFVGFSALFKDYSFFLSFQCPVFSVFQLSPRILVPRVLSSTCSSCSASLFKSTSRLQTSCSMHTQRDPIDQTPPTSSISSSGCRLRTWNSFGPRV